MINQRIQILHISKTQMHMARPVTSLSTIWQKILNIYNMPSTCSRCWVLANCYLVAGQQLHQSLVPQVSWVDGSGADAFLIKILKSYVCENMNKHQISRCQFITSPIFCFIELLQYEQSNTIWTCRQTCDTEQAIILIYA